MHAECEGTDDSASDPAWTKGSMPRKHINETDIATELRHLRELICALDRRVGQLERHGEVAIASDAARMKENALKRIAFLGGSAERIRV